MGINTISRFLIIFTFFLISCKQEIKKENITEAKTIELVEVKQNTDQKSEQSSQKNQIDFVKDFYTSYLTNINNDSFNSNFDKYLSEDLIKYVNSIDDGDLIIDAQDHEKFDLNTLKVSKTSKINIYKVEFVNMQYETVMFAKVKFINDGYKITNLTDNLDDASEDIVLPEFMTDKYYFESLSYHIERTGDSTTGVTFRIEEDFDGRGIIFERNEAFGDYFKYLCIEKRIKDKLEIYHKENLGAEEEEYTGDKSKPLITIYKKGDDFHAKSPLIKNGKEIKLEKGY